MAALVDSVVKAPFCARDENRFLGSAVAQRRNAASTGRPDQCAIISASWSEPREMAIKRSIGLEEREGISEADLLRSLELEYAENDIFRPQTSRKTG